MTTIVVLGGERCIGCMTTIVVCGGQRYNSNSTTGGVRVKRLAPMCIARHGLLVRQNTEVIQY